MLPHNRLPIARFVPRLRRASHRFTPNAVLGYVISMLKNVPQRGFYGKFLSWSASEGGKTVLMCAIIVLVGLSGFGLGRLSVEESTNPGLRITETEKLTETPAVSQAATAVIASEPSKTGGPPAPDRAGGQAGEVVASKNGSKYHFPWCSGAKAISAANKISFASTEEARKAGYTPASNCKGLR